MRVLSSVCPVSAQDALCYRILHEAPSFTLIAVWHPEEDFNFALVAWPTQAVQSWIKLAVIFAWSHFVYLPQTLPFLVDALMSQMALG